MSRIFTILSFSFLFITNLSAQLLDGSIGANFTVTDIEGNTYTLYDILDEGKSVILDLSATWCGPCWNYHQTERLENLYEDYGPEGTDEIEIFMLESDFSTNTNCLYGPSGCNGSTWGDWTEGVTYPIVNLTNSNGGSIPSDYALNYYPTLYKICPNRKVYEVGQASTQTWINRITSCNLDATEIVTDGICFGDGNGGIDLIPEGGYGSKSYLWSNGATTEDLDDPGVGSYSCTISDSYGHSIEIGPFDVDGPTSALVANLDLTGDVDCNGNNNGFINTTIYGGEPVYQFQWNNGGNTEDISNLSGGNYSLTVTDEFGCTQTISAEISEPPLLTLNYSTIDASCLEDNGSILLFAGGGTGSYLYDIGNGPTSSNIFQNLGPGFYSTLLTDENNCTVTEMIEIELIPEPVAEAGNDETIECSENSIQLNGSGSSSGPDIIYQWSTDDGNIVEGEETQTPTIDQAGTYTLTVIDVEHNCQSVDEVVIESDGEAPVADAGDDGVLNCTNSVIELDGSASSEGDSISFEWINENNEVISTEPIAETDSAGIYQIIVTNTETGCSSVASVEVSENLDTPIADAGEGSVLTCAETTAILDGSNSTPEDSIIVYEWLDENDEVVGNGDSLDVDVPGMYRLFVTNLESTCVSIDTVEVLENTEAPISDAGEDGELNCEVISVILDGSESSAGSNIVYEWLDENDEIIGTEDSLTTDEPGTYRLIVTDTENGCTDESEVIITENIEEPTSDAGPGDELNCEQTVITLNGSNSSSGNNITYEWLDEDDNVLGTDDTLNTEDPGTYRLVVTNTDSQCEDESEVIVTQNIDSPESEIDEADILNCLVSSVILDGSNSSSGNNIIYEWVNEDGEIIGEENTLETDVPGVYTLIVTNTESACSSEAIVEVEEDVEAPIANSGDNGELNCIVNSISLDGSNSSTGNDISYEWTNEDGDVIGNEVISETDIPGLYTLMVTNDSNGCTAESTVEVTENVDTPIADAGEGSDLTCVISEVTLDGSGSSSGSNISYEWQNEAGNTIATTQTVEVSAEGEYVLIVTNEESGCSAESLVLITASTEFPEAVVSSVGELNCIDIVITLDGSESSTGANYSYQWLNSNGDLLGEDVELNVSIPDTYTLVVSDTENGCTASTDILLEQNIELPVAVISAPVDLNCTNSTIILSGLLSNADSPEYNWFDANNVLIGNEGEVEISEPGDYTLVVTNLENGCTDSETVVVDEDIETPIAIAEPLGILNCSDPTIGIDGSASSSGSSYNYEWTGGNIIAGASTLNPIVDQAAVYTLLVTNTENGCTSTTQVEVIEDMEAPVADAGPEQALHCNLTSVDLDGTNSAIGPDYTYAWFTNNGNIISGENTMTPTIDEAGIYELIVTNTVNGCTAISSVSITEIPEIEIQLTDVTHINCFDGSDGSINLSASGGQAPLLYSWSTGAETNQIENLLAGSYEVTVTDQNGCSSIEQINITQPDNLEPNLSIENESSLNGNNGQANATPSGGTVGYEFLWSTGSTLSSISDLSPGFYSLTITDANGCMSIETFEIETFSCSLTAYIEEENISCFGETDGQATAIASSEEGVSYLWSTGATTSGINNLEAGTYFVTILDLNNCEAVAEIEIIEPTEIDVNIVDEVNVQCLSDENGNASAMASGGTGNYSYLWSNGEMGATAELLGAGDFSVTVMDANGCMSISSGMLEAIDDTPPMVFTQNITVPLDEDGFAIFNALMIDDGSFDNCGLSNISLDQTVFDCDQLGVQTVTLTLTDLSGNQSSQTAEVLVVDNIPPVISCSPNIISNSCSTVEYELPEVMDNCSATLELIEGIPSGGEFSEGETFITYQATDLAGNSVTCSFIVTVEYDFSSAIVVSSISCFANGDGNATVSPMGGTAGFTYQWSDGQTGMTASNLEAGDYSVIVTDATGCTDEHVFEITEPSPIDLQIDEVQDDMNGMADGAIQVTIGGGTAPYNYSWFLDNNLVSTAEDLENAIAGQYQLVIIDANGCELISELIQVGNITASHELGLDHFIKVMPNPTAGSAFVHLGFSTSQEMEIRLFDVSGKQLFTLKKDAVTSEVIELNLSEYTNGIYLMQISTSSEVYVEKIVLEKS